MLLGRLIRGILGMLMIGVLGVGVGVGLGLGVVVVLIGVVVIGVSVTKDRRRMTVSYCRIDAGAGNIADVGGTAFGGVG